MKKVLVFKTSVENPHDLESIEPLLNSLMSTNERWNFDLDDCEHILRVEAVSIEAGIIIKSLTRVGFSCAELEDAVSV
jgi:hypothetical protein